MRSDGKHHGDERVLSLLSDAASFAQRKSPRATDKTFALAKGNRAKFRSTQLTSASTILPPSVTQRGSNACVLIPRIHVLNFDEDQSKKTLRSLSLYTPETKFMSADSASAARSTRVSPTHAATTTSNRRVVRRSEAPTRDAS